MEPLAWDLRALFRRHDNVMITLYARVRMLTDAYATYGVLAGARGNVIESYGDGAYELEFSDAATGVTTAQLVVDETEIAEEPEPAGDGVEATRPPADD